MCLYRGIIQFRVDCVMFRAKGDRATGDFCVDLGPNVRVKMRVGRRPRMYANIGLPSSPSPESDRETTDADDGVSLRLVGIAPTTPSVLGTSLRVPWDSILVRQTGDHTNRWIRDVCEPSRVPVTRSAMCVRVSSEPRRGHSREQPRWNLWLTEIGSCRHSDLFHPYPATTHFGTTKARLSVAHHRLQKPLQSLLLPLLLLLHTQFIVSSVSKCGVRVSDSCWCGRRVPVSSLWPLRRRRFRRCGG